MFYMHVEMKLRGYQKLMRTSIIKDYDLEVGEASIGEIRLYQDEAGDFLSVVEALDELGIEYVAFAGQETRADTSEIRVSHAGKVLQKTVSGTKYDIN